MVANNLKNNKVRQNKASIRIEVEIICQKSFIEGSIIEFTK
jgi:hypothetical protein